MKSIFFLHVVFLCLAEGQSNEDEKGMSFLGLAAEGFYPCPDRFVFMKREIGRRPSEENYWDGTFDLEKYKNLSEARIGLTLDNPAVLTVDPEIARVYSRKNTFRISPYEVPDTIEFTVKGIAGKGFPNVLNVTFNDKPICDNPKFMKPTLLGVQPVALNSFNIASEDFTPYCGRSQIDHTELILNAKKTRLGDWPWHVAVYSVVNNNSSEQSYRCGGTIISNKVIVTAAHCVVKSNNSPIPARNLSIIAGKYNLKAKESSGRRYRVKTILINDLFKIDNLRNDIALVQVWKEIIFNQYVQPICLWNDYDPDRNASKELIYGLNGTVVGWGLDENDTLSEELGVGELNIISDIDCLLSYTAFFQKFVNKNSICAGDNNKTMNPCNGDSGGGLVIPILQPDNKVSYFLRGIISVTVSRPDKKVCDPNYYTVFTDVAQFTDWLTENKYDFKNSTEEIFNFATKSKTC